MILAVFPPVPTAHVPTPERFLDSIVTLRCAILFAVPSFLEVRVLRLCASDLTVYLRSGPKMHTQSQSCVHGLLWFVKFFVTSSLSYTVSTQFFGGGALSKEAGDILQANDFPLSTTYGLSVNYPAFDSILTRYRSTETGMLTVIRSQSTS